MTLIQFCVAASTFALFSVAVWNLLHARHPCPNLACVGRWLLWVALNAGIALAAAVWWIDHHRAPLPDEAHLCLLRMCVTGVLLMFLLRQRGEGAA